MDSVQVWCRVIRGLEWIAAAEAYLLPEVSNIKTRPRDLLFCCDNSSCVNQLRCIDDAYLVWGEIRGIGHTRQSLRNLKASSFRLHNLPVEINSEIKNLRVTASFLGKRNYSRYDLEAAVGGVLANNLGLRFIDSRSKENLNVLWVRFHLREDKGLIGIRITDYPCHRRIWRVQGIAGALHPPVAAAIALLADLKPGQTVIDPFAGSGTLLIEAGLQCPGLNLVGCDTSEEAIARAYKQGELAHILLNLNLVDASAVLFPNADRIISNPPWGLSTTFKGQVTNNNLIEALLGNLKPFGRGVFIASQKLQLPGLFKKAGFFPLLVQTLRISGRLAELVVIGSDSCFSNTRVGRALSHAWNFYRN